MLSGINKKCQQCIKECKQWEQVKVIVCPYFISKQQGRQENEEGKSKSR